MKVLVATIGFGSGHNRAAEAAAQEFRAIHPDAEVRVVDFLNWDMGLWDRMSAWTYFTAIKYVPSAYQASYKFVAKATSLHGVVFRSYALKMRKYLNGFPAELVISTHVFCAKAASTVKAEGGPVKEAWGVLTDFIDDRYWNTLKLDRFFVASEELKAKLSSHGIPASSVELSSIPVRAEFRKRRDRAVACSMVNEKLNPHIFTVLALGGGNGLGALNEIAAAFSELPVQVILVAGSNKPLKESLDQFRRYNHRLFVFGYVDNIHDMMDASDVCVTKPGGVTIAECMAKGLSIIVYGKPLPGPETENVEYLVRNRAASFCSTQQDLKRDISKRLAGSA